MLMDFAMKQRGKPMADYFTKREKAEAEYAATNTVRADLISRQAAIAVADSSDYVGLEVVKGLKRLPSAERVAHWENGYCSRCHAHAPFWMMASTYYLSNYCPACGARMDDE